MFLPFGARVKKTRCGKKFTCSISRQKLPYWSTLGWNQSVSNLTLGGLKGQSVGNFSVNLWVSPSQTVADCPRWYQSMQKCCHLLETQKYPGLHMSGRITPSTASENQGLSRLGSEGKTATQPMVFLQKYKSRDATTTKPTVQVELS